jgi:hypothetical protein
LRPNPSLSGLDGLIASGEGSGLDIQPSINIAADCAELSAG